MYAYVAEEITELVRGGWFANEQEIARQALMDFIRRRQFQLQEDFQRQDIRWAENLKETKG